MKIPDPHKSVNRIRCKDYGRHSSFKIRSLSHLSNPVSLFEPQKSTTLSQVLEWESVSIYRLKRSLASHLEDLARV
jgi:hypothetical protein